MTSMIEKYGDLEIGDIVTLNSGGPEMTVIGFDKPEPQVAGFAPSGSRVTDEVPVVKVAWFTPAGGFNQAKVHPDALVAKDAKDGRKPAPAPAPVAAPHN